MIESANNLNIVGINDDVDNNANNKNIVFKQGKWKLNDTNKKTRQLMYHTWIMVHLE